MQNIKKYFNLKTIIYLLLLVLAYYLGDADLEKLISNRLNISTNSYMAPSLKGEEYIVNRVIDGDTVHVTDENGKEEILRFLAVDTLEKNSFDKREKCLAYQETDFTKENLLNRKVTLKTDSTQDKYDKYGRLLVYISLASSTKTFNEVLLETGNARVFKSNPPATNYEKYLQLQTEAQRKHLGMWNTELCR